VAITGATGFFGVDLNIAFDPAVIVAKDAIKGALTDDDCDLIDNIPNPPVPPNPAMSEVLISLVCTLPVSGDGQLVQLVFDVVGAVGATSALTFTFCQIDEDTDPARCTRDDGSLTVVTPLSASGRIVYYNGQATRPLPADERPVSGADVGFSGDITATDTSDTSGGYLSPDIVASAPNVVVRPSKQGEFIDQFGNPAITSFDAALVARHLVGLITLNARQLLAAETSGNNTLNSLDAQRIAQFRVGLRTEFAIGADCDTDFIFLPDPTTVPNQTTQMPSPDSTPCVYGQIAYNPLNADAANQDFIAILIGDVSGNWGLPPGGSPLVALQAVGNQREARSAEESAQLSVGDTKAKAGSTVTVPVKVAQAKGGLGVDLALQYAPDVLAPLAVEKTALSQHMTLVVNLDTPGLIRVALFGSEGLKKGGQLLKVSFTVIGEDGMESPLELVEATVDEQPADTHDGLVRVR
jgi:hypothetical protein